MFNTRSAPKSTPIPAIEAFNWALPLQPQFDALKLPCARARGVTERLTCLPERASARRALMVIEALLHPRLTLSNAERIAWLVRQALSLPMFVLQALLEQPETSTPSQPEELEASIVTALWVIPGLQFAVRSGTATSAVTALASR